MHGSKTITVIIHSTTVRVNGSSSRYAQDTYLIGIGLGKDIDTARSAARAEIAKIFKAKVMQAAQDVSREKHSREGAMSASSSSMDMELKTSVTTDEILEGVEIPETWEAKNKTFYALAVLNKAKLRNTLSHQILSIDESIAADVANAQKSATAIEQLRGYSQALMLLSQKEELLARKRVVDPVVMQELSSAPSEAEIRIKRDEVIRKIVFVVDAGTNKTGIKETVAAVVSKQGFTIIPSIPANNNGLTIITLKCSIETVLSDRANPQWKFCDWKIYAELFEEGGVGAFATISKEGQSAHLTEVSVQNKALLDAKQELSCALENAINEYICGNK
jgi:hypothetical protein